MGLPNLKLRGGSYHWQRKIMVAGQPLPLSISLRTGNFYRARLISDRLSVAVEGLSMAYGQFSGMSREQMKQVFSDALRWQLQLIEQDQTGSLADPGDHATANSLHAEAWEFLARGGVAARWTLDEHQRLVANGWNPAQAKTVANIIFDLQNGGIISGEQLADYSAAFGFPVTADNVGRIQRLICKARAAACREATAWLSWREDESEAWIDEALGDDAPFAFGRSAPAMKKGYVERVFGAGVSPEDVRRQDRGILLGGKRLLRFTTSALSQYWLSEAGQETALTTTFDDYILHAFGMHAKEHMRFAQVTGEMRQPSAEQHLARVARQARRTCGQVASAARRPTS